MMAAPAESKFTPFNLFACRESIMLQARGHTACSIITQRVHLLNGLSAVLTWPSQQLHHSRPGWIRRCLHCWQERKAAVIRAEGESESARLISDATKAAGPGMIELRRIEAAKDIADKMARGRNIAYLPSGNNMLLGLGTGGQ